MLVVRSAVRSLRVPAPVSVARGMTTSALRPSMPLQLQVTQPSHIATPMVLGCGLIGACVYATYTAAYWR